eukprot:tig00021746_g23390.t1
MKRGVNPGIPCADGTHAHHSHPHWHLLAARPLINPKGHSEHKRLNAAVTRIIADTATEDDVTTLRTWIAIARETTTIAAINTNISNTNEQLRRPYRGAEGEQLLHLVEMAAMAITNTGAPPPRTRQAAANHVTSVLRKELEAFDVDTTVQAIVNALCARRVFTFTDGAMDTTDAPPAPTTTLTLPGAAVVESLLNRVKTSFTDAQNRSPTFMRPNRRTAAVNYVESTLRTYLRGYDVESTILLLVYILEREGELRFASGPDATSAKAADAYARFVAANAPTDPVAGPSSVATAEGLAPEDKTPIVPPTTPTPPAPAVLRPKASEDRADNDPINRNRKLREMLMDIAEDSITLIARRHQAAGRYEREGGDRVFASRTVEKIMVSVGGQQILLFLSPVDMPAPCHTCSIGPDGPPVIVNHRLRASVISIAHRYYEYIDSTTGNTVTMTNVELQEHCRLCTTPPYMEFVRNCPVPSPTSRQRTPYPSTLRPDDAPADITLDALYGVTMEMKTLFLRIIGLLMDITPQGTTSLTGNDDWPRVADIFLNVDVSPFTVRASTLRPGVRDASTGPIGTRPIILAPGVVNTSGQDTSRLARTTVNASLPACLSAPAFYHAHALMHPVDEPNTRLGPTPTDLPPYPVPETTVAAAGGVSRKLASIYVAAVLHDWPARQRDKIKPHLTLRTNDVDMEYLRLAAENARLRDPTQFSARYLEVHNVLTDILRRRTPGTPSPTTPPDKHAQLLADEQLARELQARLDAEAAKGEDPVQAAAQAPYLQAAIGGIARGRTMDARRRTAAAQAPPRQSARHGGTVRGRGRALPIHTSRPQTPGNPHYHDDDMTCPTAPVTPPTDVPEPPAPRNDLPPAPEVTASSTDTPDAQPVAPATTTPDAQPVAPVTTTPVAPTPALETPVSSTAARDASPIAPAMATSLTTPHSVPPGHDCDGGPAAEPGPTPMLPIPSLHPDYTAPTDASMPDSTTADSSGTERTEDVPMGDPRVSRGIIVDTPTLPSPHDDRDSPPDTDEDTSSDSEPEIKDVAADLGHRHAWTILRLKPVVHNQLRAYLDTPRRFMVTTTTTDWRKTPETPTLFAASELTSCMHLAAARSNTPTGQPLLGTRPSDQAHYLLQHLTEFRSVIHVIMRLARAQPFAPGETATTWPHPNDPLADVLGRPEMLELFGLTPTEFTLVHQSKTPVVPCILQVAVNLARNLRTLHYDVEMTESDERFLNFDKITNTATRLATIRQLVQTVKFTAPLTGPDDIYLSTLRHGSPPPDIALSMRSTALARAWDIAAYFDHYKWDETRDRYGDSRFAHLYDVRDPAPSSDRPWPTSHAPLLSMLTEQVENVLRLVNITADVEGPGNFLRRYYTSRFNPKSDANPATNQRATAELAEEIRLNSQLAVVAARDVHRLRTPPVSESDLHHCLRHGLSRHRSGVLPSNFTNVVATSVTETTALARLAELHDTTVVAMSITTFMHKRQLAKKGKPIRLESRLHAPVFTPKQPEPAVELYYNSDRYIMVHPEEAALLACKTAWRSHILQLTLEAMRRAYKLETESSTRTVSKLAFGLVARLDTALSKATTTQRLAVTRAFLLDAEHRLNLFYCMLYPRYRDHLLPVLPSPMVPVTDPLAVPVPRPPERDVDEYGYLTQWTSDGIDILPRVPDWDSLVGLVDDMSKDTFWNSNTYLGLRARAMVYGTERKRPREKRPNDEKLQKKERKAARLTPEEVDSIISRILSELHTVPFKEVLLSENADIPDVYFWAFLNEEWAKGFTVVDGAGYQHGVWPDLSGVMVRREPRPDSTENERDTFYAGFGRRNNHINGELFAQTINDCPEETRAGGDFLPLDTDPGRDTSYHIFMTPLLFTNTDFLATAYCKTIQEHGRHAPHIFAVAAHILGGPAPFGQTADLTEELTVEDGHRPEELPEPPPVEELEGIPTRDPPPVHPATTTKKYMHVLGEVHMPYVLLGDSGLEAFLRRVPYMRPFLMKMHVRWSNFSRALSRVLRYGVGPGTYPYRAGAPGHGELSQHNRAGLPFRSFLITAADEFHPANKYADYFDCIYDEDNHAHLRDSASRQDVERCFYEIAMPDDLNAPPMTLTPANADLCGPRIVRFTHVAPAGPSRGAPNAIQNRSHITIFDANNRNTWQQIIAGTRKPPNEAAGPHPCGPDPKYFPVLGFPLSVHTWVYGIAAYLAAAVKLHGALSFFLEPLPGELGNIIIDYVRSHEDELHFRFTASGEVARSAKLDKWYEVEYPDCERVDPAHLITAFESLLHKATNDWLAVQIKHETPPAAREDVDMDRNHCWP